MMQLICRCSKPDHRGSREFRGQPACLQCGLPLPAYRATPAVRTHIKELPTLDPGWDFTTPRFKVGDVVLHTRFTDVSGTVLDVHPAEHDVCFPYYTVRWVMGDGRPLEQMTSQRFLAPGRPVRWFFSRYKTPLIAGCIFWVSVALSLWAAWRMP